MLADFLYYSVLLYAGLGRALGDIGAGYFDHVFCYIIVVIKVSESIKWDGAESSDLMVGKVLFWLFAPWLGFLHRLVDCSYKTRLKGHIYR